MRPIDYLRAARCPPSLLPQEFGLWTITKKYAPEEEPARSMFRVLIGGDTQTALERAVRVTTPVHPDFADEVITCGRGEIVMEDSHVELKRHLPIWLAAHGRVLVTGLGLGCVVRGLLASPNVSHIDVIEIDPDIALIVGEEFVGNPRVTLKIGDALTLEPPGERWDFAWHDIWCEGSGLQKLHLELMGRYRDRVPAQGAWMLPRFAKRFDLPWRQIG